MHAIVAPLTLDGKNDSIHLGAVQSHPANVG